MAATIDPLGKKIFFLYPASVIKEELLFRLIEQEYEVYSIGDHQTCLKLLRKYPHSIVYANIDEVMNEDAWKAYLRSIRSTKGTEAVGIGICSYNANEEIKKNFLVDVDIDCGFVRLKIGLEESTAILLEALKANEAKGRRKYVRASCDHDTLSSINVKIGEDLVRGRIQDISSVGFACVFDTDPGIKKNTLLQNMQLKLRGNLIQIDAVAFGVREAEQKIYVFLFTPRIAPLEKTKIRRYIQASLQTGIELEAQF